MLNSYGNIAIANAVRETVRVVQNVNNEINDLFTKEGDAITHKFKYLSQSNLQLKQEEFLSKVYYRFWMKFNDKNTKKFVGTVSMKTLWICFQMQLMKRLQRLKRK